MIATICGTLRHKSANYIIVEAHGIGYGVSIPLSTFYELPDVDETVRLTVYTHVKEDAIKLFGFLSDRERDLFQLMISVSGIGPRLAVTILSGIAPDALENALSRGDLNKLVNIPGVGKKTAERMIFELRDKMAGMTPVARTGEAATDTIENDALSALVNLGYRETAAQRAVRAVLGTGDDLSLETVLMEALKLLSQ